MRSCLIGDPHNVACFDAADIRCFRTAQYDEICRFSKLSLGGDEGFSVSMPGEN